MDNYEQRDKIMAECIDAVQERLRNIDGIKVRWSDISHQLRMESKRMVGFDISVGVGFDIVES